MRLIAFFAGAFPAFIASLASLRARRAAFLACLKALRAALCSVFTMRNCFLAAATNFSTAAALATNASTKILDFPLCSFLDLVFISRILDWFRAGELTRLHP